MKFVLALLGAVAAIKIQENPTGYIVPTNPNQGGAGNPNAQSIPNGEQSYNVHYPNGF